MAAASTVRPEAGSVTQAACSHAWDFARYFRGTRTDDLDCQSPLDGFCTLCAARMVIPCRSHRASRCRPCSKLYARRVRSVAHSGVTARRHSGFTYLLTLTAPSELGAHCFASGCKARDGECRHKLCPCSPVGGVDLATWNATAGARWNRTRTALKRLVPQLEFFRAVEVQEGQHLASGDGRGALHLHVLVWSPVPLLQRSLRELGVTHGWGHELDLDLCQPGSQKAATYVSKYVSKACDARGEVPWLRVRRRLASYDGQDPLPTVDRVHLQAVQALGDLVSDGSAAWDSVGSAELTEPRFWNPFVDVLYDPDGDFFVQVLDDGDDWLAWSPVKVETVATHRNWSMSQGWGLSMASVMDAARDYAFSKREGAGLGRPQDESAAPDPATQPQPDTPT